MSPISSKKAVSTPNRIWSSSPAANHPISECRIGILNTYDVIMAAMIVAIISFNASPRIRDE